MTTTMKGFKATDKDMKCRDVQFVLGEWQETKKPLSLCKSGFHFCKYPSGVFAYYDLGCRVFEIEAEGVLDLPETPGADYKLVCSRIRLVKEIFPDGKGNTGFSNTGNRNTGDSNTGNRNTGDSNTGFGNTGDSNTGDSNTGFGNTGDSNTGNRNTGNRNTGFGNTGNRNTGDSNTGFGNTGFSNTGFGNTGFGNTGFGNTGDFQSGFFCKAAPVYCFDKDTGLSQQKFKEKYPEWENLYYRITEGDVEWEKIKGLPGITKRKLAALLKFHRDAKKVSP